MPENTQLVTPGGLTAKPTASFEPGHYGTWSKGAPHSGRACMSPPAPHHQAQALTDTPRPPPASLRSLCNAPARTCGGVPAPPSLGPAGGTEAVWGRDSRLPLPPVTLHLSSKGWRLARSSPSLLGSTTHLRCPRCPAPTPSPEVGACPGVHGTPLSCRLLFLAAVSPIHSPLSSQSHLVQTYEQVIYFKPFKPGTPPFPGQSSARLSRAALQGSW